MILSLPIEHLRDDDLEFVRALVSEDLPPGRVLAAFFAELAETCRVEQARRVQLRIERTRQVDPLGVDWFGRIQPETD